MLVLDMDRSERFVRRLVIVVSDAIVYLELNLLEIRSLFVLVRLI